MMKELEKIAKEANRVGLVVAPLIGFIVILAARPGRAEGIGLLVLALIGAGFGLLAWVIPQWVIRRFGRNQRGRENVK